jgi:hypothetical protein
MKAQDVATLQGSATVLPANATRSQILNVVADTITGLGTRKFRSLHNVELATLAALRATAAAGTIMEPIATAAQLCGRTIADGTVGAGMDALNLTQADVNLLACHCHNGDELSGEQAADNLRTLAARDK